MDKARILIVDDNTTNLEILSEILSPEYRISVAINGYEAIELASNTSSPDLILLDIMMPGIDGYQVCEILKKKQRTAQIPIIFITAVTDMESEERGLALGAVDYITKPIVPSIVKARVKTHLALFDQTRLQQQLVHQRTAELEKAMKEAEIANKAKDAFLANISHELRTPLNGMIGMTQLLMSTDPSTEQVELLNDALTSSSRLLSMVNDLLALTHMKSDEFKLHPSEFHIRGGLKPIINHFQKRSSEKGLAFDIDFKEEMPRMVLADVSCIRQILINLLNNAVQYTDEGDINVCVYALRNPAAEQTGQDTILSFSVSDTGVGIEHDKRGLIFEPFFIGENYMTKKTSGAGLGLAISRHLASKMGGYISLDSNTPDRTVFTFTVPCKTIPTK